jgi:2-polyprenyl-6-methoxyphenol hydroxylase-like FAD-dependent oxidoreductase
MNQIFDAIIIGAGIIESATSLALGRKGWRVLNIDKFSPEDSFHLWFLRHNSVLLFHH